jgi:hypothetical protein
VIAVKLLSAKGGLPSFAATASTSSVRVDIGKSDFYLILAYFSINLIISQARVAWWIA